MVPSIDQPPIDHRPEKDQQNLRPADHTEQTIGKLFPQNLIVQIEERSERGDDAPR